MGTNLTHAARTCDEGNSGGTVLAFSVIDRFGNRDCLVGLEVSHIIGLRGSRLGRGLQQLGWGHQGVPKVGFPLHQHRPDPFVVSGFPEDLSHN